MIKFQAAAIYNSDSLEDSCSEWREIGVEFSNFGLAKAWAKLQLQRGAADAWVENGSGTRVWG